MRRLRGGLVVGWVLLACGGKDSTTAAGLTLVAPRPAGL